MTALADYWQARAIEFGHVDHGLPAVCSYAMPSLYNRTIDVCQRRALSSLLSQWHGLDVLDVGCGVGRWSLRTARGGNRVVGVDLSPRMIELATASAARRGVDCQFAVQDLADLALGRTFDVVLGVTVLQHIVDDASLHTALSKLAEHLRPHGTLVLLEVAPERAGGSCDSAVFRTRTRAYYESALKSVGLGLAEVRGVDIAPWRRLMLPALRRLPPRLARATGTVSSVLSLPLDFLLSRYVPSWSWHKLFVAQHRSE